jgi:hypothetical protein
MIDTVWYALGSLHVPVLLATIVVILYSDYQAWLYFSGKKKTLSPKFTFWSHRLIWVGLGGMILSGMALIAPAWQFYASDPVFYIKMWFVLVLVINAVVIGRLMLVVNTHSCKELAPALKKTLLISGFLSGVSWVGAMSIGYFFL